MAVAERRRETVERNGEQGVFITRDEYREYEGLKAKRDRSEESLRTQMRLLDDKHTKEKIVFARDVKKLIDAVGLKNLTALLMDKLALEVYDRANEILATE